MNVSRLCENTIFKKPVVSNDAVWAIVGTSAGLARHYANPIGAIVWAAGMWLLGIRRDSDHCGQSTKLVTDASAPKSAATEIPWDVAWFPSVTPPQQDYGEQG